MLVFAICANIFRYGKVIFNSSLIILNITLITTFSTTGYVLLFLVYFFFSFRKVSLSRVLFIIVFFIPVGYMIYNIDFVSKKFVDQIEIFNNLDTFTRHLSYRDEETSLALERIPSIGFEFNNWLVDPILGYGYWPNSWFAQNVTESATTCGGFVQVFSTYGVILGAFFYYCLFISSRNISRMFYIKRDYILFVITLATSISYPVFGVMFFTSIWFYGLFLTNKINE